jgi:hypothetical protein
VKCRYEEKKYKLFIYFIIPALWRSDLETSLIDMRIKELTLKFFGPFRNYRILFLEEDQICLLLTGKNNEGKSSLINSLRLLNAATKVIGKTKQGIYTKHGYAFQLLKQDTENLLIGRLIHNYLNNDAEISGVFINGLTITVYLDPVENIIYTTYDGRIPSDIQNIFGFLPPLGPLSETEELLQDKHVRSSINTSLAPRHLRNHLLQIMTKDEYRLVQQLINKSWQGIELLDCKLDLSQNRIDCYYKEDRVVREISWAGQGLQVWFQIVTHVVRLRNTSILILDEPEVNLHPEKQNELIRILTEYYHGSILIATHSVELMNNVSVSHIINIQKKHSEPKIKSTKDRAYLDLVRSQVGSNFNLIASQFDIFDLIIFTEDTFDYNLLKQFAEFRKINQRAFNIPIHGFSEYKKCIAYKDAYKLLIGRDINYTLVLDRDYYPDIYLTNIKQLLQKNGIRTVYTPGKEIENLFITPQMLNALIPAYLRTKFNELWEPLFFSQYIDAHGSFLTLHEKFLDPKIDIKTINTQYTPTFNKCWESKDRRHNIIGGKTALKILRNFYREEMKSNLSDNILVDTLFEIKDKTAIEFINEIYHFKEQSK